jgi:nitroreductase
MKKVPQESKFSSSVLDTIYSRRSVRRFTDETVPEDIIGEILRAGSYAPSGCNCQPGRFVVINNSAMVND